MNFPGGPVSVESLPLTCNGASGAQQLWQPEQPRALDRLTDEQLERLAGDLDKLVTSELAKDESTHLTDYIALVSAQVASELLSRMVKAHGL
jgi:hypothetical protein